MVEGHGHGRRNGWLNARKGHVRGIVLASGRRVGRLGSASGELCDSVGGWFGSHVSRERGEWTCKLFYVSGCEIDLGGHTGLPKNEDN